MVDLVSWDSMLKDYYPRPGERIKQYVVDQRRLDQWVSRTSPRFIIEAHDDNCGSQCRNFGPTRYMDLRIHDCCNVCNDLAGAMASSPEVIAWQEELKKQPQPCDDRTKLSNEIAPSLSLRKHPTMRRQ